MRNLQDVAEDVAVEDPGEGPQGVEHEHGEHLMYDCLCPINFSS